MATINLDKMNHDKWVWKVNVKLFAAIFELFDEFDMSMWEDTRYIELVDIWCKTLEDCREWYGEVDDYAGMVRRKFIKEVAERMCAYE